MGNRTQEKQWFENQEEISGIVTQLKKHHYNYPGLSGVFRPYPYEVNYEKLLEVSGGNHSLVDAVKSYINKSYFDQDGNPKEYGGFNQVRITLAKKREMMIPDQRSRDRIHVIFDNGDSVHLIAGPIGDDYVFDLGVNKSFLYSMSEML